MPYVCSHRASQRGWILLEVMGSCILLGVVLMVLQTQIRSQWDAIGHELENHRKHQQESELIMMRHMLQNQTWLLVESTKLKESSVSQGTSAINKPSVSRPNCNRCSGKELERWFKSRY
ncbi:hypothetical protein [Marinomonas sp. 2405UD68-3]|uniref:hypothetical protein n=1 Tax=Marinomonas sp. 2405UD68-3 TaxID=3391835 RepID=UPI0039C9BA92